MSEWPVVCISSTHFQYPKLATDLWVSPQGYCYPYCESCSVRLGIGFKKYGYKWSKLPDTSQAQPTSERVKP